MELPWRIQLLAGLRVHLGDRTLTRFRTQKTGALLAYLAYYRERPHPRELLVELLWPEAPEETGRHNLRIALSSLRRQLEPPGVPPGAVIMASRLVVQLNPASVTTDVAALEAAMARGRAAVSDWGRAQALASGVELYSGDLLPGYYEEWCLAERERLREEYLRALHWLIDYHQKTGDLEPALRYARRAVHADPLREEAHQELIRLLAASGEAATALRHYRELVSLLQRELDEEPSAALRSLAERIQQELRQPAPPRREAAARPSRVPAERALAPPTGTVTLLMMEVEGAAVLEAELGPAFRTALARHYGKLGELVREHGGLELPYPGPVVLAWFGRLTAALRCADACRKAAEAPGAPRGQSPSRRQSGPSTPRSGFPQLRIALHVGELESGQEVGSALAVQSVARLLSVSHAGQILCTEQVETLVRGSPDAPYHLTDLGLFHLPEGEEPARLFQVDAPVGSERIFPPPLAAPYHPTNLPLQLTRFFGREDESARVRDLLLLQDARLVTLTGVGGSGKSRLALEAARLSLGGFGGRVWYVSLTDLADPHYLPHLLLDALRLPHSPGMDPLEDLIGKLQRQTEVSPGSSRGQKPSLLLLDDFGHLGEGGAVLIRAALARVPGLRCLVTSRRPLEIEGERELTVLPLPIPEAGADLEAMMRCASVQLFLDRAQAVYPDFQVTRQNSEAIGELCRRLEGIPLALELAAMRRQTMSASQMLSQLDRRLDFLVRRRARGEDRHRTMRGAIEWSYRLLSPELQRFFARLSVFRGGWTLDAATACTQLDPLRTPDCIAELLVCSLCQTLAGEPEMRFGMLETLREFAWEELSPAEAAAASRIHADYFLSLAEAAEPELRSSQVERWLRRLEVEQGNLRAALAWCLAPHPEEASDRVERGLRLAGALAWYWQLRGHLSEGRGWLEQLLDSAAGILDGEASPGLARARARAALGLGLLALAQGDLPAARLRFEEARSLSSSLGETGTAAYAELFLALLFLHLDPPTAAASLAAAREAFGRSGDRWGSARSQTLAAWLAWAAGEPDRAKELLQESIDLWHVVGDPAGLALALNELGTLHRCEARPEEAEPLYREALRLCRRLEQAGGVARVLYNLGCLACSRDDYRRAESLLRESLFLWRDLDNRQGLAETLAGLARVRQGQAPGPHGNEAAVRLLATADSLFEQTGSGIPPAEREEHHAALATARDALAPTAFARAWQQGLTLPLDQVLTELLAASRDEE